MNPRVDNLHGFFKLHQQTFHNYILLEMNHNGVCMHFLSMHQPQDESHNNFAEAEDTPTFK